MSAPTWLNELETLSERFSHLGVSADLASLSLSEAWYVLRYLRRLADTQAAG